MTEVGQTDERDSGEPAADRLPSNPTPFPRGRVLAVDYGERRVGLAISDPLGIIATPAGAILRRPGKRPPIAEIIRRADAREAVAFVVGLPLDGGGDDTPRAREVRQIGSELARRTGRPVRLVDERYTTAAALRAVREMGGSVRGRKEDVDALAAAVLLRHALDLLAHEETRAATRAAAAVTGREGATTITGEQLDAPDAIAR